MNVKISNNTVINSGGVGIRVVGVEDLEISDCRAINCAGGGIQVIGRSVLAEMGLPEGADLQTLVSALERLKNLDAESRQHELESSKWIARIWRGSKSTLDLSSKLLAVLDSDRLNGWIAQLEAVLRDV